MPLPAVLENRLTVPAIAAPMFLTSGPELVISACQNGVVGSFPALNQRSSEGFEDWLSTITTALSAATTADKIIAPYAVNLIVHKTNKRLEEDLRLCVKYEVPIVITSLGAVADLVDQVHAYGGIVFHDVTTMRHARKAMAAGVDGLILVCAGGGGHASALSPFAFMADIRKEFQGTIILAGTLSTGRDIVAARMIGADLAYLGTRFLATQESMAAEAYKKMVVEARAEDIVYTPNLSGVPANFLARSLEAAGLDLGEAARPEYDPTQDLAATDRKIWKTIWSAGPGCAAIDSIPSVAELISDLRADYLEALRHTEFLAAEIGAQL